MMDFETFKAAVDSMEGFPHMVGIMGGEPLLHPQFEQFCNYAVEKLGRNHLGLWSSFPVGKEHLRGVICRTFDHIFLNDHTRGDIYHHPLMVGISEVMEHEREAYMLVDQCWVQNSWSASINPHGAFFCEVAAAWSILLGKPETAWPVEKGWWWRVPKDFTAQVETFCLRCGGALPLKRRVSVEGVDDISPENYKLLGGSSPKLKRGAYKLHNLETCLRKEQQPLAAYKDEHFRDAIAKRYGIYLMMNELGFQTPYMISKPPVAQKSYIERMQERYT
jgi:hypothetical protein